MPTSTLQIIYAYLYITINMPTSTLQLKCLRVQYNSYIYVYITIYLPTSTIQLICYVYISIKRLHYNWYAYVYVTINIPTFTFQVIMPTSTLQLTCLCLLVHYNYERKSEQAHIPHAPTLLENAVYNVWQFQALGMGYQTKKGI